MIERFFDIAMGISSNTEVSKIVTVISAGMPQEYVDRYNIVVLPIALVWGEETLRDGVDILPGEFFQQLDTSPIMPTTSVTAGFEYKKAFRELLEAGNDDLLIMPISSGLSGSYYESEQARELVDLAHAEAVDTKLVSIALSFMTLSAARAAKSGASLMECKEVEDESFEKLGFTPPFGR